MCIHDLSKNELKPPKAGEQILQYIAACYTMYS